MNRRELLKALFAAPLMLLKFPETLIAEEDIVNIPSFCEMEFMAFPVEEVSDTYVTNGTVWIVTQDGGKTWTEVEDYDSNLCLD